MARFPRFFQTRGPATVVGTLAVVAGFAAAALVGVAVARTFTVQVAKNANVTNQTGTTTRENILVTSRGLAVYELTGDSRGHPKCTRANSCFSFWPPAKVSSGKNLSKAPGISGRLGVWHRDGFFQLTLAGHPLYTYAADTKRDDATGQGVHAFGGTWHVIKTAGSSVGATTTSGGTTTMTTTTTTTTSMTTTTTCTTYPPYC
jgi:predicted lipoprotein with Yx(FWY)xxD motif